MTHQADWMSPQEYREAIAHLPVALVPWGAFEWHGPHLPLGLDGLKPHLLSLRIAGALGGGVVFPPIYAGHRTLKNARKMPYCIECQPATVMAILWDTLTALADDGFRQIVIVPGHYGMTHRGILTTGIESWAKARGADAPLVWQASDYELGREEPEFASWDNNDHAGMWETALFWGLAPEAVHIEALEERPEGATREDQGILGRDPRRFSSRALGERIVEAIVRRAVDRIRAGLA
ncbi:MAG: creatininase family protein [Candidatus Sumerlaeia bacterium]|nr:creatininase family protein [Candidatus Sumerlaeia bacterium]